MTEGSVAYVNMRCALLGYVGDIPFGSVTDASTLAEALNLPARHVAHILSRLSNDEVALLPWHRVIPRSGAFTKAQMGRPRTIRQIALLEGEGATFVDGAQLDMSSVTCWKPPNTHRSTLRAETTAVRPRQS